MGFRLKTSRRTQKIFEELSSSSNLKPFALSKIAIAFSLKDKKSIADFQEKDTNGIEFQRSTITGEYDTIFKTLIEMNVGKHITEDEYCPYYLKLHMDRGAEILYSTYKYAGGSLEKFLKNVLKDVKINEGCIESSVSSSI